jgi:hypothetical protein
MAAIRTDDTADVVVLPELIAAYRRRAERTGVACESVEQIEMALAARRAVRASAGELRCHAPDDPLGQRGLARLIDQGAGSWLDHIDVERATRDELP